MATATLTMTESEAAGLHESRKQLTDAERALKETALRIAEVNDELAVLQSAREAECEALARGKPKAAPEQFDGKIQSARDRLFGLEAVMRTHERSVRDLKTAQASLLDQQNAKEQKRLAEAETRETASLIEDTRRAIHERNELERKILDGISTLRARKYLLESNRRVAMDGAMALQRNANGMRA